MTKIVQAMVEEFEAMKSGHFIPYHKVAFMIALVTTIVFSVLLQHTTVFEGKISVIDLDNTQTSIKVIESLNSSSYINVHDVYHSAINPDKLLSNDRVLGVLYIPKGFSEALKTTSQSFRLGYFADYSNSAQNAEIIENLNEFFTEFGAQISAPKIGGLVGNVEAVLSPTYVKVRRLYDSVFSATNSTVISFIYFFSSLYLSLTLLMIKGRINVTGQANRVINMGFIPLIARIVPYVMIYVTAITLVTSILVTFGQLRFAGNYLAYIPSLCITGFSFGLLALLLSWNAQDPGAGAAKMILIVPGGFITGGATMATAYLPDYGYVFSHLFPLTWQYKFFRNFALRGSELIETLSLYGTYLMYMLVLLVFVFLKWHKSFNEFNSQNIIQSNNEIVKN